MVVDDDAVVIIIIVILETVLSLSLELPTDWLASKIGDPPICLTSYSALLPRLKLQTFDTMHCFLYGCWVSEFGSSYTIAKASAKKLL